MKNAFLKNHVLISMKRDIEDEECLIELFSISDIFLYVHQIISYNYLKFSVPRHTKPSLCLLSYTKFKQKT